MRGIAALCVAIFHSFGWLPIFGQLYSIMPIWQVNGIQATLAKLIVSFTHGTAWVNFFFVLSGFVLARSLRNTSFSLKAWALFVIRRIVRIMPTYAAALVLISGLLGARYAFHLFPGGYDGWFPSLHFVRITAKDFFSNLTFLSNFMDPPSWSLHVEMVAALCFPAVYAVCRKFNASMNVAIWAAIGATTCAIESADPVALKPLADAYKVIILVIGNYMFLVGITCAMFGQQLVKRLSDSGLTLAAVLSVAALSLPALFCGQYNAYAGVLSGLGSFGLVAVLSSDRRIAGFGWLDARPARFIGRISFSFYVVHYLVMYMVVAALTDHKIPGVWDQYPLAYMAVSALFSLSLATPLAWALYTFVELPSIALASQIRGRTWTKEESEVADGRKIRSTTTQS